MKVSAGLLVFRQRASGPEVLLVHPGGPYWSRRDDGFWTVPKGEVEPGEDLTVAAVREFHEETGFAAAGDLISLGSVRQKSGKVVHAWACLGDFDPRELRSNTFRMEWPPKSGRETEFPEIDRGDYFDLATARIKLLPAQIPFLEELERSLSL